MKILVTGADGCIGSTLLRRLSDRGHAVLGAVYSRKPGPGECRLDLERPESVAALPGGGFDAVIHAAGLVNQSLPARLIRSVNAASTRRLISWARRSGCRHFVFISSVAVYGVFTMGCRRRETTPVSSALAPLPYMRSKIQSERYVRSSGLPYTILRLPPVLGRGDSYLSPAVISALIAGRFFFAGRGDRLVSIITLDGLARVMEVLLAHGPLNSAYNCADHHIPWRELAAVYAQTLGKQLPAPRRSIFTAFTQFSDKPTLLLFAFSLFGAHFPDDALHRVLHHNHCTSWRTAVAEAVEGFNLFHDPQGKKE